MERIAFRTGAIERRYRARLIGGPHNPIPPVEPALDFASRHANQGEFQRALVWNSELIEQFFRPVTAMRNGAIRT